MLKHIFSDMDGTLLAADGKVAQKTVQAVAQTRLPLTLVSARAPMEMAPAIDALGLVDAQIAFNGGLIFTRTADGFAPISARPLPLARAAQLLATVASEFPEVSLSYYDQDRWYAAWQDEGIAYEQRLTGQAVTIMPQATAFAQPGFAVFKLMMITFDAGVMAALKRRLTQLAVPGVSIQQSGTAYLEITSAEAKKSRGIQYILDHEQLTAAETASFGDGHNDLPMLNMVGLPIVMANALPEIQAVARYVTKANTEDGVAYALTHYPEFQRDE